MDLSLKRITKLLDLLHSPQHSFKSIHLAGTNGKGSIAAMMDTCLRRFKVATFNSPHLMHPRDAIRINGKPLSLQEYHSGLEKVKRVDADAGLKCTSFELQTALAFYTFAENKVDVGIIEVGLGGRDDATNVLDKTCLAKVITSLDLDHLVQLGPTIQDIARHKAGIFRRGVPVVIAPQRLDVESVLREEAEKVGVGEMRWVESARLAQGKAEVDLPGFGRFDYDMSLPGSHQLENSATALQVLDLISHYTYPFENPLKSLEKSDLSKISSTKWPGRLSWFSNQILVDGAHNPGAAKHLREYVDGLDKRVVWIMAMTDGKTLILEHLVRPRDVIICTSFSQPEGMSWIKSHDAQDLVLQAKLADPTCMAMTAENVGQAMEMAKNMIGPNDLIVVSGSLYLLADLYREFRGNELDELY